MVDNPKGLKDNTITDRIEEANQGKMVIVWALPFVSDRLVITHPEISPGLGSIEGPTI